MSNGENPKSFEDAMKRIVEAKSPLAMNIQNLNEKYEIPGAYGKTILFTQIFTVNNDVEGYYLEVYIVGQKPYLLRWLIPINQYRKDTALIEEQSANPIKVPINSTLHVILKAFNPNGKLENAILYYKVLGSGTV